MTYNSVGHIAFCVEHDTKNPYESLTLDHIREQLLKRIIDLNEYGGWRCSLYFNDTREGLLDEGDINE